MPFATIDRGRSAMRVSWSLLVWNETSGSRSEAVPSNAHEKMSSFNGKPQATVGRIRRRLRLAVKRTAAKSGSCFVSNATVSRNRLCLVLKNVCAQPGIRLDPLSPSTWQSRSPAFRMGRLVTMVAYLTDGVQRC
jgi:hypothetical protein